MNIQDFARTEVADALPASQDDVYRLCYSYLEGLFGMSKDVVNNLTQVLWQQHGDMLLKMAADLRSGALTSREAGNRLSELIRTDQIIYSGHADTVFKRRFDDTRSHIGDRIRFVQADADGRRKICMDRAKQYIERSTQSGSMTRQALLYLVEHPGEEVSDEVLKDVIAGNTYHRSFTQPKNLLASWKQKFSPSELFVIERIAGKGFKMKFTLYPDLQDVHCVAAEPVAAEPEDKPQLLAPFSIDSSKLSAIQQRSRDWVARHIMSNQQDLRILAHYFIQFFGKVVTDADIKALEVEKRKSAPAINFANALHIVANLRKKHMDVPFVIVIVEGGYQMIPAEMVRPLTSLGSSIFPPAPEKPAEAVDPVAQRALTWAQNYPYDRNNNVLRRVFLHLAAKYPQKLALVQVALDLNLSANVILAAVEAHEKQMRNKRFGQDFRLDHDVDTFAKGKPHYLQLLKC